MSDEDIKRRDDILSNFLDDPGGIRMGYTIKKVFEETKETGEFHYSMSNCGHEFLITWDKDMLWEEPEYYPEIAWKHYVFAAVFTHFWCKTLFGGAPEWVHKYKHEKPYYQCYMPKEMWKNYVPQPLKEHNYYYPTGGVWYV